MSEQSDAERSELFEIYKLHAELADRVSQRREGANRLYVSILTGFLVAIMLLVRLGQELPIPALWFFRCAGLLGMGLCFSWYTVIRSYRQLNTGKFEALGELEKKLAYPFFCKEWELLEKGEDFRRYWKLTVAETALPILFGASYLGLAIYSGFV